MLSATVSLTARDFDIVTPSGHTLYCDIVTGGAKIVGWDYSPAGTEHIHLVIPSHVSNGSTNFNVVAIGDSAFMYSSRMTSVVIPSSVRSIGRYAFCGCVGLGSIAIPSSVDSIGPDALSSIPNVEYSGAAQGAPWGAFYHNAYKEGQYYYADSLKTHLVCCDRDAVDVTIPPTVTSIGMSAFSYCDNLTSVRIDSTITNVGSGAFRRCSGLDSVFFNPQASEGYTFSECINLRHLTFGNTVSVIPISFCYNCVSLQEIVIPDNITSVQSNAFIGCTSLESAVVGGGLTQTGRSMFEGCTSLVNVSMSDDIQTIDSYTFANCSSLREVIIPTGVTSIGIFAYSGCSNVERIACMRNTVPNAGNRAFDSIDSGIEVIVPCNRENQYRQASQWQRFDNIKGQSYYMVVTTNNLHWGRAVATQQPTCDNNTATIEAIPEEGCRFVKWDDNNTDNPRQITYNGAGYVYRKALFESTVGIENAEVLPDVKIYASNGSIVIDGAQGEQVWVFDIMGRLMLDCEIRNSNFEIQHSKLHTGVYLVKVGNRKTQKVVLL